MEHPTNSTTTITTIGAVKEEGVVVGSSAESDKWVQQHEQQPLMMQSAKTESEKQNMKVMVALDDSDASFYALNWALTNLLKPTPHRQETCLLYLVNVQHSFTNYVYPAGPGLHTGIFLISCFSIIIILFAVSVLNSVNDIKNYVILVGIYVCFSYFNYLSSLNYIFYIYLTQILVGDGLFRRL